MDREEVCVRCGHERWYSERNADKGVCGGIAPSGRVCRCECVFPSASSADVRLVDCLFEQWWESQGLDGEQTKASGIDRWALAKMAFNGGLELLKSRVRAFFEIDPAEDVVGWCKASGDLMALASGSAADQRPYTKEEELAIRCGDDGDDDDSDISDQMIARGKTVVCDNHRVRVQPRSIPIFPKD